MAKDEVRDRLGNIDQIRDIIFGTQIREYNERLERLESAITRMQQDTRDRIDQIKAQHDADIKTAIELLDKRLKSVQTAHQAECLEVRQQTERLNQKFSSTIQSLDEAIDRQLHAMQTDLGDTKREWQQEVNTLKDLVLAELDQRWSQMWETKVSKENIAETLFELGMRLKGAEFIPTLRDAGSTTGVDSMPLLATRKPAEEIAPMQ